MIDTGLNSQFVFGNDDDEYINIFSIPSMTMSSDVVDYNTCSSMFMYTCGKMILDYKFYWKGRYAMTGLMELLIEFAVLIISSMVYATTIIIFMTKTPKTSFVKAYLVFTSVCLYWSIGEILVILLFHFNRPLMEIIIPLKYIAGFLLGPLWLIFSLYYTNSKFIENGLSIKKTICIFLPSLLIAMMAYSKYSYQIFSYLVDGLLYFNWGFWLHLTVQLIYIIFGCVLIIRNDLIKSRHIKKHNIMIVTGIVLSIMITFLYYLFEIHHRFNNMDIVPSSLLISIIFFGIASLKFKFLNILPTAFPEIIHNINEGILIVDFETKVSFYNQALSDIFMGKCKVEVGMSAFHISKFLSTNSKYNHDGEKIIAAIGKGAFVGLKGEMEFLQKQFQLYYQPLFEGSVLIGWVISFIDISEHKVLLADLSEKNKRLANAYEKLLEHARIVEELAAATERNKLAMEIHDSQGHCLSLLVALLEIGKLTLSSNVKMAEEKLDAAYEVAKQGLGELRNTVSSFTAIKLSGNRLVEAIESMIGGFVATGMVVDFTVQGMLPENLSEDICTGLYNICREALTNVLKHSEASSVNVILRLSEKAINFYLFDNGKGCDPIIKGNGLKGMESKVSNLNGHISFGSGGEKGFSIHVEIPLSVSEH